LTGKKAAAVKAQAIADQHGDTFRGGWVTSGNFHLHTGSGCAGCKVVDDSNKGQLAVTASPLMAADEVVLCCVVLRCAVLLTCRP
jgi:hypothetical protein